jgi:hypothetical protein
VTALASVRQGVGDRLDQKDPESPDWAFLDWLIEIGHRRLYRIEG